MGKKRKRPSKSGLASSQSSTAPRFKSTPSSQGQQATHPVISLYYRQLLSLRQYLLAQLPISSKSRRRRLASLSASSNAAHGPALAALLDSTLVGVLKDPSPSVDSDRQRDYRAFTQSQSLSTLISTDTGPNSPQSEVVDFVIDQLFKHHGSFQKFQHLLTHGFQRSSVGVDAPASSIPGIVVRFPNQNVRILKEAPWTEILGYLGQNGDEIMLRLLFDCGIFAPIDAKKGVYYQLSGLALSSLEQINQPPALVRQPQAKGSNEGSKRITDGASRSPNEIVFLRRNMLYCKFASALKKRIALGLGKAHVLNRFASLDSRAQTIHVMMYMFPRQFGLRNAFSSTEDHNARTDYFKSQAFREDDIFREGRSLKVPKRLRGTAMELVHSLRIRHSRCSYAEILRYYCPTSSNGPWRMADVDEPAVTEENQTVTSSTENLVTQLPHKLSHLETNPQIPESQDAAPVKTEPPTVSLTDYATPASAVSAFCRSVLLKIIPLGFFGYGPEGKSNRRIIMKHVDCFIRLRRFESLSLHEVCKGLKITAMPWLDLHDVQRNEGSVKAKLSLSDFQKRTELVHEFVHYIFESILVPLVRHNFYVTESQTHRNQLFYFRHDVWQRVTETPFQNLKANMLEELDPESVKRMLPHRRLGYGSLRLLPKSSGLRPILNLRQRPLKESVYGGKKRSYLGASVNSSLTPVYNMLTYERKRVPASVGSSLHHVGEIHHRVKQFKRGLMQRSSTPGQRVSRLPQLFFVKLDIQACFDNIPQEQLIQLVEGLVSEKAYHITKHAEISLPSRDPHARPSRRFLGRAAPLSGQLQLPDLVASGEHVHKGNTVFIDTINQKQHTTEELLNLFYEHVLHNTVKMGKKYFRQRSGIAQGSVLSSLLCNFFYAKVERDVLGFLRPDDSLLMRLVDDFLLITTDCEQAKKFLETMIRGQPAYNVAVNPAKSMTNFSAAIDGIHLPRLEGTSLLPYCGIMIDTHTLEINRDTDRIIGDEAAAAISNTLTVEANRLPGATFRRKVLAPFKLRIYPMYLDDVHNSRSVVLGNLYTAFVNAAMRMYLYVKSLRSRAQPTGPIIIQTINDLIHQTFGGIKARRESASSPLSCFVQLRHLQYLAVAAFRFVLRRKQTRFAAVLRWLDCLGRRTRPTSNADAVRLLQVVKRGTALFDEWRF
ncbi:Telomere reverse transcriptase [Penicillium chermesinum]|uniref:Telomerase reverse transcriptase n=1 Tax=Penicillium chermesinum TaxID=63820 RepID=A0A9W9PI70_9EURO|nr:Telomere reverse transcriptase [Penicillium chermesinum]KAJ5247280.1 Telomere reverse transcriptase [Penicillium chermesinum]